MKCIKFHEIRNILFGVCFCDNVTKIKDRIILECGHVHCKNCVFDGFFKEYGVEFNCIECGTLHCYLDVIQNIFQLELKQKENQSKEEEHQLFYNDGSFIPHFLDEIPRLQREEGGGGGEKL